MKTDIKHIEQIAFYVPDMEEAKSQYRRIFGITDWSEDMVTASGGVAIQNGSTRLTDVVNVAKLAFNYDLGYELELIKYVSGMNWHAARSRVDEDGGCHSPFLSHKGYHVAEIASELARYVRAGLRVVQNVHTISHTNPKLAADGRKYHYVVFDSRDQIGFDLKLIKRIITKPSRTFADEVEEDLISVENSR